MRRTGNSALVWVAKAPALALISSAYHLGRVLRRALQGLKSTCTTPKRGPKPEPHSNCPSTPRACSRGRRHPWRWRPSSHRIAGQEIDALAVIDHAMGVRRVLVVCRSRSRSRRSAGDKRWERCSNISRTSPGRSASPSRPLSPRICGRRAPTEAPDILRIRLAEDRAVMVEAEEVARPADPGHVAGLE